MDLQSFYPPQFVPQMLKDFHAWYLATTNDPVVSGAAGLVGKPGEFAWIKSFFLLEGLFQLPTFFVALYGLWIGSARINLLILIYAASTTTTVLACVSTVLELPTTSELTIKAGLMSLTDVQRYMLLASYVPFMLVPAVMMVDMGLRTLRLVETATKLTKKSDPKSS
ncbi:hypothetical protein DACRYDRAFT_21088 [Dacryopinax primogenitus]|uniref:Efficient mitochondria targeting-associated protein 19 n=1 Tax=Dacryopinax primogenitus (strain DJM 731) TaxID=1858805 RepID=M5GES2_DACPD|nr:uncharacterized protein DACRYDRAFT_21088 [Dacryopinax primogenitus]EJU03533.1 hypothetical protein DACRYDRAFT_21088 [Dacryopinax primogenitus]